MTVSWIEFIDSFPLKQLSYCGSGMYQIQVGSSFENKTKT